jgi:hypothetical protein
MKPKQGGIEHIRKKCLENIFKKDVDRNGRTENKAARRI